MCNEWTRIKKKIMYMNKNQLHGRVQSNWLAISTRYIGPFLSSFCLFLPLFISLKLTVHRLHTLATQQPSPHRLLRASDYNISPHNILPLPTYIICYTFYARVQVHFTGIKSCYMWSYYYKYTGECLYYTYV